MVNGDAAMETGLDLVDAIKLLRDQVAEAKFKLDTEDDKGVHFRLGEITVELGMELAHTRGANAGLRFSVMGVGIEAGGKRESTDKATHKVTVRLHPHLSGGGDIDVSDEE